MKHKGDMLIPPERFSSRVRNISRPNYTNDASAEVRGGIMIAESTRKPQKRNSTAFDGPESTKKKKQKPGGQRDLTGSYSGREKKDFKENLSTLANPNQNVIGALAKAVSSMTDVNSGAALNEIGIATTTTTTEEDEMLHTSASSSARSKLPPKAALGEQTVTSGDVGADESIIQETEHNPTMALALVTLMNRAKENDTSDSILEGNIPETSITAAGSPESVVSVLSDAPSEFDLDIPPSEVIHSSKSWFLRHVEEAATIRNERGADNESKQSGLKVERPLPRSSANRKPRDADKPRKADEMESVTPTKSPLKKSTGPKRNATQKTPLKPGKLHKGHLTPPSSQSDSPPLSPSIEIPIEEDASLDSIQLHLSKRLSHRHPIPKKPYPQGKPEVWADSRQALCETLPHFKAHQSGCHRSDRHIYAFLFDGIAHCREHMDSDLIIARAGGSMEADGKGPMHQKKHQCMSESQVQSVINDMNHQNPFIVICGSRNEGAICKMPYRYCVLGWYKPVAVWAEKTLGKGGRAWTTIQYRFERLNASKAVWYAPRQAEELITEEEKQAAQPLERQNCAHCNKEFPKIYLYGWMCLNSDCSRFWKTYNAGNDELENAPIGKMHYNPAFLLHRTTWPNESEPFSVRPRVPDVGKVLGDNLTYINTRGICCPECGRCNSRRLFQGWKCDNPVCNYSSFPKHIPINPPVLHEPWEVVSDGPALARNKYDKDRVKVEVTHQKLGFKVFTYTFSGIDGRLVHAIANKRINEAPGGPDEMFMAMQKQDDPNMDLGLERRRFTNKKAGGEGRSGLGLQQPSHIEELIERKTWDEPRLLQSDDKVLSPLSLIGLAQSGEEPESGANSQHGREKGHVAAGTLLPLEQHEFQPSQHRSDLSSVAVDKAVHGEDYTLPTIDTSPPPATIAAEVLADGDLMTAFSANYGLPYKFVASSSSSRPFKTAPWPIRACRADLNWAARTFLSPQTPDCNLDWPPSYHPSTLAHSMLTIPPQKRELASARQDLNELLLLAYLEGQKMGYHDDGEYGLGSTIASLSLGGKARMSLRMKAKHFVGCSKTGLLTPERPVPGGYGGQEVFAKRLSAWEEVQSLTTESERLRRRKEIPHELGLYSVRNKKSEELVSVTLGHGDIVIMEGYEIQQYLEHMVKAEGCLRFAMTCRTILEEHLGHGDMKGMMEDEVDEVGMSWLGRMEKERQI